MKGRRCGDKHKKLILNTIELLKEMNLVNGIYFGEKTQTKFIMFSAEVLK